MKQPNKIPHSNSPLKPPDMNILQSGPIINPNIQAPIIPPNPSAFVAPIPKYQIKCPQNHAREILNQIQQEFPQIARSIQYNNEEQAIIL